MSNIPNLAGTSKSLVKVCRKSVYNKVWFKISLKHLASPKWTFQCLVTNTFGFT